MALSVVMPALEMAQETGKLVSWLKKEGEQVRKGEMLLEVETDKAVVEIEAAGDGRLAGVTAKPGDVVQVGRTIAWLVQPGETPPTTASPDVATGRRTDTPAADAQHVGRVLSDPAAGAAAAPFAPRISPKARRLAQEHGVDIARVNGSGPGGEILADDILAAAKASGAAVSPSSSAGAGSPSSSVGAGFSRPEGIAPITSIGRIMADRTTQSWTTVPHFFVTREVDATALKAARETLVPEIERSHGVKITFTDLIVAAVAHALRRQPRMNASWNPEGIKLHPDINIALAIAVPNAVVTAVIHKTDTVALGDIAVQRRDLSARALEGRLRPTDITGATFTISNLGMFHVDAFTAIIVPPQAGILAVGAIADRAVPVDGQVAIRPMMTLTLSCDHRVTDGARAALFLNLVVEAILHLSDLQS
jgi:pyruvate dehydrogenase E2 component (dihydrolipoyllysine-residue acetyltransferase)